MYSAVIWIYCIKEEIYDPSNGKERCSDLTRRAENAFVLYVCITFQSIKMFWHILPWIRSRVSFLNTWFRGSMRNWKVSQFQGILLLKKHNRILDQFFREVIRQHMASQSLNILKICLIYCCKYFCPFEVLFSRKQLVSDTQQVSSTWQDPDLSGVSPVKCHGEWHERLMPEVSPPLPHSDVALCTQVTQGPCNYEGVWLSMKVKALC